MHGLDVGTNLFPYQVSEERRQHWRILSCDSEISELIRVHPFQLRMLSSLTSSAAIISWTLGAFVLSSPSSYKYAAV